MKKINWKVRFTNPIFITQLLLAIILPVLTYMGLTVEDITSWGTFVEIILSALGNPYIIGLVIASVWNAVNDPTTSGTSDSSKVLTYTKTNSDKG